jgi:hypothetical protein
MLCRLNRIEEDQVTSEEVKKNQKERKDVVLKLY